jgi:hypothetical protein
MQAFKSCLNYVCVSLLVASVVFSACNTPVMSGPFPQVEIISPQQGDLVSFGSISVDVQVTNFNLVDKLGQANVPGEGHLIYYLDVGAPTKPGSKAQPLSGTWEETASIHYLFDGIWQGTHTLSVALVNNDGTVLNPPALARVSVLVME